MRKLIICALMLLVTGTLSAQTNNSHWSHVGPISTNLQNVGSNQNKFETGRMELIAINHNDEDEIAIGGYRGGLWWTTDQAENWENVSTIPIGTNAVSAITFNDNGDLYVANCIFYQDGNWRLSKTTALYKYNHSTTTWTTLGALPTLSGKSYRVEDIVFDPDDDDIVLVGTTHGLFRSTNAGSSWTKITSGEENIRKILPAYNSVTLAYDFYITGTDVDMTASDDEIRRFLGEPFMKRSTDGGVTFSDVSVFNTTVNIDYSGKDWLSTTMCLGNSGDPDKTRIYTLSCLWEDDLKEDIYAIHEVEVDHTTSLQSCDFEYQVDDGDDNNRSQRMAIDYDGINDLLWFGGTYMRSYDFVSSPPTYSTSSNINDANKVHADIHDVVVPSNNTDILYIVSDGGFYISDLNNPGVFSHKNEGLHIAMVNGFSGASYDPDYYLVGLFDIIHTNMFNQSLNRTEHYHSTHENDGGVINAFDNESVLLDHSSYSESYHVSTNGGETIVGQFWPSLPTIFGKPNYYQDPFRERIYVGLKAVSVFEFDSPNLGLKFKLNHSNTYLPFPNTFGSGYESIVSGMAFSKHDENSVHIINSAYYKDDVDGIPSFVLHFIGDDFNEVDSGYREVYGDNWAHQWDDISPDWENGTNIPASFTQLSGDELYSFTYTAIAKSNFDDEEVFVSCGKVPNNQGVKVLKYDGTDWIDYSNGISSDEDVTAMVIDHESNDGLYAITESGLYYRDATMSSWIAFNTNLPRIYANQLEINYLERTIRAGTHGRGIWKSSLKCPEYVNHVESGTYIAHDVKEGASVTSTAVVDDDIYVMYKAGDHITLNPGFATSDSSRFTACIQTCDLVYRSAEASVIRPATQQNLLTAWQKPEGEAADVSVSPNPNRGVFNVTLNNILPEDILEMEVYDVEGKKVFARQAPTNLTIDISGYPSGIYWLRLTTEQKTISKKVIHQ